MQRRRGAIESALGASRGTTGSALHGLILAGGDHRERCRSHPNIPEAAAMRSSVSQLLTAGCVDGAHAEPGARVAARREPDHAIGAAATAADGCAPAPPWPPPDALIIASTRIVPRRPTRWRGLAADVDRSPTATHDARSPRRRTCRRRPSRVTPASTASSVIAAAGEQRSGRDRRIARRAALQLVPGVDLDFGARRSLVGEPHEPGGATPVGRGGRCSSSLRATCGEPIAMQKVPA